MEQWLRDNKLQDSGAASALDPIVQASQLLQARKTEADVDSICEMCSRLTTSQVSIEVKARFTVEQPYMLPILYCQYPACWCPDYLRSQGISKHGIDPQSRNIPSLASEELRADRNVTNRDTSILH